MSVFLQCLSTLIKINFHKFYFTNPMLQFIIKIYLDIEIGFDGERLASRNKNKNDPGTKFAYK